MASDEASNVCAVSGARKRAIDDGIGGVGQEDSAVENGQGTIHKSAIGKSGVW